MPKNFSKKAEECAFKHDKAALAVAMIQDGEPFDKIQKVAKISLDRIRQLAERVRETKIQ